MAGVNHALNVLYVSSGGWTMVLRIFSRFATWPPNLLLSFCTTSRPVSTGGWTSKQWLDPAALDIPWIPC